MFPATRAMPSAGRIVPNTSPSGRFTTARQSPVRVSTLTRTLTPKPKNALVSPRTQYGSGATVGVVEAMTTPGQEEGCNTGVAGSAARTCAESATQPKMPPWAAIMSRPTRWNSGK